MAGEFAALHRVLGRRQPRWRACCPRNVRGHKRHRRSWVVPRHTLPTGKQGGAPDELRHCGEQDPSDRSYGARLGAQNDGLLVGAVAHGGLRPVEAIEELDQRCPAWKRTTVTDSFFVAPESNVRTLSAIIGD